MRSSKTTSALITNSDVLSQAKSGEEESTGFTLSLPPQSNSTDHLSNNSDVDHKNKSLKDSRDKNKQHDETSSGKHENASSPTEASGNSARHDREATPLATNANPKIVVGESDDGEISSGNSTPVAKVGYDAYDTNMSPATSTSTLTIHSPPECNGHSDAEQHYRRQPPKLRTEMDIDSGIHTDYRDKYYGSSKLHKLQPPHEQKFKRRSSGEFQTLKELEETNSLPYSFNHQMNVHDLSQVDHYSQSSLPRLGVGKKRTSLGEFYNSQESPPSPRHFLSQSVMSQSVIELSEQDEMIHLSQMSERGNLSRMASEPYLYNAMLDNNPKYQHPSSYRYSSGSAYSQVVPHSGSRQGNTNRNRQYMKNRERVPGRRHSGENTHHPVANDKSNSTSNLSQPRRG